MKQQATIFKKEIKDSWTAPFSAEIGPQKPLIWLGFLWPEHRSRRTRVDGRIDWVPPTPSMNRVVIHGHGFEDDRNDGPAFAYTAFYRKFSGRSGFLRVCGRTRNSVRDDHPIRGIRMPDYRSGKLLHQLLLRSTGTHDCRDTGRTSSEEPTIQSILWCGQHCGH